MNLESIKACIEEEIKLTEIYSKMIDSDSGCAISFYLSQSSSLKIILEELEKLSLKSSD